jgi:hypothetical protein
MGAKKKQRQSSLQVEKIRTILYPLLYVKFRMDITGDFWYAQGNRRSEKFCVEITEIEFEHEFTANFKQVAVKIVHIENPGPDERVHDDQYWMNMTTFSRYLHEWYKAHPELLPEDPDLNYVAQQEAAAAAADAARAAQAVQTEAVSQALLATEEPPDTPGQINNQTNQIAPSSAGRRKSNSPVWSHFTGPLTTGTMVSNGRQWAIWRCAIGACGTEVRQQKPSTGNLCVHLQKHHPQEYYQVVSGSSHTRKVVEDGRVVATIYSFEEQFPKSFIYVMMLAEDKGGSCCCMCCWHGLYAAM